MYRLQHRSHRRALNLAVLVVLSSALVAFTFDPDVPENQGMLSAQLTNLVTYSDQFGPDSGLLVLRNDKVVLEHYTGTGSTINKFGIKSATKSFGAGLLVKALDDATLNLTDLACGHPSITVHHAVTMTSGIQKSDSHCNGPFLFPVGTDFSYSDGSVNVFADKLRTIYGNDLEPLMASALMDPIGAEDWNWTSSQTLSSGLSMSIRDMTRYGRLWLRGGDWDGVQVLSAANVALATAPSNPALKPDYGYLWWVRGTTEPPFYDRYGFELNPVFPTDAPSDSFLAAGCTRSWILVIPSLQLVAARAGGACISIQSGTTQFTDEGRGFVEAVLAAVSACSDGVDNDGDSLIDYPADPDCTSLADSSEATPVVPSMGRLDLVVLACAMVGACGLQARSRWREA
jgi:CubicO group peptidase (beta-lactamase class C family)